MKTVEFLSSVRIFSDLTLAEREVLVSSLRPVILHPGEVLFRHGDPGDELYVVQSGRVLISLSPVDGELIEIQRFGSGEFFGEMSIFEDDSRSADCSAIEATELLALPKSDFFAFMETHPRAAIRVMYRMLQATTRWLASISKFHAERVAWSEAARRRSVTDQLTGLHNRGYLDHALDEMVLQARMTGAPLCMIMLDLDQFNDINERAGHTAGDGVLVNQIAPLLRSVFRPNDVIARYGGDEFVILLPATTLEEAFGLAERVRSLIEDLGGLGEELPWLTASLGLANFPLHAVEARQLRECADQALYLAKGRGRNRVEMWEPLT